MSKPEGSNNAALAVLFDLDGTLVDPAGGITGGIAYALRGMGLPVPGETVLNSMVGPKLAESLLVSTEATPEHIPELIARYRQWYHEHALAMSRPYPGMVELLSQLRVAGMPLAVATQKPQTLAETILAHHGLTEFFTVISGDDDDERVLATADSAPPKARIVAAALRGLEDAGLVEQQSVASGPVVMVGDREHDVYGARANGLDCLGVSWGFAAPGELIAAGAVALFGSVADLGAELVARQNRQLTEEVLNGAL